MFDPEDKDELAKIGFFYLQWASGKSCYSTNFDVAFPLAHKYFGVSKSEFFTAGRMQILHLIDKEEHDG